MIPVLTENPILLLFVVAGIGYGVGSIRIKGSGLGVAAVLFVGLFVGSLSPDLRIPDVFTFLGLTIFVYTVGLSSGPVFFSTFQQRGSRDLIFVFLMLTFSASVTIGLHFLLGWDAALTAGLFAGSSTNTPALAGVIDVIGGTGLSADVRKVMSEHSVIGYSLSYPMGVIGPMLAIMLMQRLLRIDYAKEEKSLRRTYPVRQDIVNCTVLVDKPAMWKRSIRDLKQDYQWTVMFGRMERQGEISLTNWDTQFQEGDRVALVGDRDEVEAVAALLGTLQDQDISFDQSAFETRRFFVSNSKVAGQRLASLNLSERFAALITRVRRGDIDLLASADTVLELGDRVRVVGRRKDMPLLAQLFGDSYDQLSHINLLSFGFGIALGLLLGLITFQLPGGMTFQLGLAGGPIIVGLLLGGLRRTGPINWALPYSASLVLRQFGLILLLTGIGVNSGHQFVETLATDHSAYWVIVAGGVVSILTSVVTLLVGFKVLGIPFSFLTGMVANQPAILDFAITKAGNKLPNIGYTLMLPISFITKVVYAQLLFALLR